MKQALTKSLSWMTNRNRNMKIVFGKSRSTHSRQALPTFEVRQAMSPSWPSP